MSNNFFSDVGNNNSNNVLVTLVVTLVVTLLVALLVTLVLALLVTLGADILSVGRRQCCSAPYTTNDERQNIANLSLSRVE